MNRLFSLIKKAEVVTVVLPGVIKPPKLLVFILLLSQNCSSRPPEASPLNASAAEMACITCDSRAFCILA